MDFALPKYERVSLKESNAKDVNQLFKYVAEIGFGTYGRVYKAFSKTDNSIYALKKLIIYREKEDRKEKEYEKDGFPITALREIKFLQNLDHPNIIKLHQIVISSAADNIKSRSSSTYLVFEFMDYDFLGLMIAKLALNLSQIKYVLREVLKGVQYLHSKKIIHRDLKSANILYNKNGEIKIADFGLARIHNKERKYTNEVVTLWYRAPELLLGSQTYDTQIDLWSVGCFMGELMTGEALFRGDKNPKQLEMIYEKCGSPNELNWSGVKNYQFYDDLGPKKFYPRVLTNFVKNKPKSVYDEFALDLLDKLLFLCPQKRLNATEALDHQFFKAEPKPCEPFEMPTIPKEIHAPVKSNLQNHQNNKFNDRPKNDLRGFDIINKKIKKD